MLTGKQEVLKAIEKVQSDLIDIKVAVMHDLNDVDDEPADLNRVNSQLQTIRRIEHAPN